MDGNKDGGGGGVPRVEILKERVGKGDGGGGAGEAAAREVIMVDVFEKYEALEETVFGLCSKSRDSYLLHFHLESHDRCDVKLKDRHWDMGTYFRHNLLSDDGALRLIPHFVPLVSRSEGAKKRGFEAMETVIPSYRPQKKRVTTAETTILPTIAEEVEEPVIDDDVEEIDTPATERIAFSYRKEVWFRGYRTKEQQPIQRKTISKPKAPIQDTRNRGPKNHGRFAPKPATTPLPPGVTYSGWRVDFEAAKQRYVDKHLNGVHPDRACHSRTQKAKVFLAAHTEMIEGKYGMTASDPCGHCFEAGVTCRVYHTDCLEWDMEVNKKNTNRLEFGWRCLRCRMYEKRTKGGCDAMHEH